MIGLATALAGAGSALALDVPLPLRKPLQERASAGESADMSEFLLRARPEKTAAGQGGGYFITGITPPRKPDQKQVVMALSAEAKAAEATRIAAAIERDRDASPAEETVRLSPAVLDRQPSIFDRMFSKLNPGRRLSDDDAARYAHIFAFQDVGDLPRANAEIEKLSDMRLMGHVLWQRYTGQHYRTTYQELADWMKRYADHPGAQRIYDLAKRRQPQDAEALTAPRTGRGVYGMHDFDVGQLAQPYIAGRRHSQQQRDLIRAVGKAVARSPTLALKRLEGAEGALGATEYDALRADIAASYFYNGKIEKARELALESAARSGRDVPLAGWIGGLSLWQAGDYEAAARHFELTAQSARSSAWMSAAGAYWAARAHLRARQPQKVNHWLRRAAEYPRTFYGIIAMKALGMEQARFNWKVPELTDRHVKALSQLPAGWRALALVAAERPDLAESELRQINPGSNDVLQEAMIALANDNGMPGLALRMGSTFRGEGGKLYDAALYPDVPWEPAQGFSVDRSLVYAFIRQESRFETDAANKSSGALGLMQLMPGTAKHVARQHGDKIEGERLQDPTLNIDLGQKYIRELLKHDDIGNNLFKLAVAYNAGPGRLARWDRKSSYAGDPLLFIESIPSAETRIFVERVLANYWIYRIKYGQEAVSLNMVAEGSWPVYVAQDDRENTLLAAASRFFQR